MPTPKLNATFSRKAGVALDRAGLHLDGATNSIDDASELNEDAIACPLDDTAVMRCDGGIDQIAPQPAQSRKRPLLIGAGKLGVSDDVSGQDSCDVAFRSGDRCCVLVASLRSAGVASLLRCSRDGLVLAG
jgi:hypothetical protein